MKSPLVRTEGDIALTTQIRNDAGVTKTIERLFHKTSPEFDPAARQYCSTPEWFPKRYRLWYEKKFGDFCRLHDNDRGIAGVIKKDDADRRFGALISFRGNPIVAFISYTYLKIWGR